MPPSVTNGTKCQLISNIITHSLGLLVVVLTFFWAGYYRGFGWEGHAFFSFHPTFMVLGSTYLLGTGISVFRLLTGTKYKVKVLHLIINLLGIICTIFATFTIFILHGSGNHLKSIHSWIGLLALIILCIMWPISFLMYYCNWLPGIKATCMPWHVKFGQLALLLTTAANLTGFQWQLRKKAEEERTLINVTGFLLLLYVVAIMFILTADKFRITRH